ncbi:hypothetical protein EC991_010957 [Linnemannia zychae]|nr:hypothetical protein EC991_010957 [Linnemannia zychae]
MPPLQHSSTFDPTAVIPFSDHASPFDNLFDSDLNTQQQQLVHQQLQQAAPSHDTVPSEADISALFGLPMAPPTVPVHTSAAVSTPAPRLSTASPSPPRPSVPSTLAPLAPVAHYSSLQHNHLSQEKSLISPIPSSPAIYNGSAPPALTSQSHTPSNAYHTVPTTSAFATKKTASHRYPTYETATVHYTAQTFTAEPQGQYYEQHQSSAPYQQYSANADYSQHGYTYTVDDTSSKKNRAAAADPLMLNAPSRSIFSRFGGGGGNASSGLSTESHSAFAPKFKVAASYVSSTLAVTSTFASEKLATASTKIADLWQHNQHSLPQQQPQQQPQQHYPQQQQQQQQHDALYSHGHHYGASTETPSTINSGHFSGNQSDMHQQAQYSYEGQGLNPNPTPNSNYQSSYNNIHSNSTPSGAGAYNSNNISDYSTRSPFASTASSTLSNAASVAGSYLPSLSKLPALPALSTLPALRSLPALPWVGRDKSQQLPQQQPSSEQQYHQYPVDQKHASDVYYGSYTPHDATYQQPQQEQQQQPQQPQQGYGYQYYPSDWWGGIRNEVQKGRRMVQTGVQVGVAWWWDSSEKNPLGGVV